MRLGRSVVRNTATIFKAGMALGTIHAIGCAHEIFRTILKVGGDYLLTFKANQPTLSEDLKPFCDDAYERDTARVLQDNRR